MHTIYAHAYMYVQYVHTKYVCAYIVCKHFVCKCIEHILNEQRVNTKHEPTATVFFFFGEASRKWGEKVMHA
jgi:hypothetical protein